MLGHFFFNQLTQDTYRQSSIRTTSCRRPGSNKHKATPWTLLLQSSYFFSTYTYPIAGIQLNLSADRIWLNVHYLPLFLMLCMYVFVCRLHCLCWSYSLADSKEGPVMRMSTSMALACVGIIRENQEASLFFVSFIGVVLPRMIIYSFSQSGQHHLIKRVLCARKLFRTRGCSCMSRGSRRADDEQEE